MTGPGIRASRCRSVKGGRAWDPNIREGRDSKVRSVELRVALASYIKDYSLQGFILGLRGCLGTWHQEGRDKL